VPGKFKQEISLNNNKTNEKLVMKATVSVGGERLLISRHSSKAANTKHKIKEDEKEILEWEHYRGDKRICLDNY
jgi:hypothetical protein